MIKVHFPVLKKNRNYYFWWAKHKDFIEMCRWRFPAAYLEHKANTNVNENIPVPDWFYLCILMKSKTLFIMPDFLRLAFAENTANICP